MPSCKISSCPVAKDGRCLEGRGLDCPNLITSSEILAEHDDVETPPLDEEAQTAFDPLPGAHPLEVDQARYFSSRGRAVVVAFVGVQECGKTSLLARLHQLFLTRPLGGYDFAGSRSLPRFEELNWLATMESGAAQPKMPRTSSQFDNSLLHLCVRPSAGGGKVDLLINDISGETYSNVVASQSVCDTLLVLARADHLVVLVDGAALADLARRNLQISDVGDFLQRVIQTGQCGRQTALHVVVSKLDELRGSLSCADVLEVSISEKFSGHFGSISYWRIAARPMDGSHPTVEPIEGMFASWVQSSHRYPLPEAEYSTRAEWGRDFCCYGI